MPPSTPEKTKVVDMMYDSPSKTRVIKLMSDILLKQSTPKSKKALTLKIDVNQPKYDADGKLIHDEELSEEDEEDPFDGIFNAHLLDEEEMDKHSYKGSMTDESNTSSHNNLADMEEEDI